MARVTLVFEDVTTPGLEGIETPAVGLSALFDAEGSSNVTQAGIMGLAVKKLFDIDWLGQNCQKIVPEMFATKEEKIEQE